MPTWEGKTFLVDLVRSRTAQLTKLALVTA